MPRILHAYLDPARLPARAELQAAITGLRFKLTLDEAYAPYETQGYLPCTLEGEDAGVDLRFERDAEGAGGRSVRVVLRWGGDPREHLAALVIAAALAQAFDALVLDPEKGTQLEAARLSGQARALVEENF